MNQENDRKDILLDHTLIINEIDKSLKCNNLDCVISFLPSGSFLVGGYIRDLILRRLTSEIDVDIVVPKNAIEIGREIASKFQAKFIMLDEEREVVRIIFKGLNIDIASQNSPNILIDLCSRDFSLNSIAFSFKENLLIDPLSGIQDIQLSLLKTHSQTNLVNDPLRILRCFRFVSELDFNIDEKLINFIKKYKNLLALVPNERINYELLRIIRGKNAIQSIFLINKYKLFSFVQSQKKLILVDFKKINLEELNQLEREKYLPLFFLNQILDEDSLKELKFSKPIIRYIKLLRKWQLEINIKSINQFTESERFELHQELETILPAFIFLLPQKFHINWLERWRNKEDRLFHPSNLIKGDVIKKYLKVKEGPILGRLINYLSMELAFNRLDNFDEAIYKGKQWIKQNAPKCD